MKLPALLTSDLHLVESASTEYRWGIFPWLHERIKEERVRTLCVLGDLTDAKDYHSSQLVNRVVREIRALGEICRVLILAGNHDWMKNGQEYFRFLSALPGVTYINHPWEDEDPSFPALFLPYSRDPARAWKDLDLQHYDYVFMHQTIRGARSSNGAEMEGDVLPDLRGPRKIYSGDIHVPQTIGALEYVGSPYHVHFGDNFEPRCVLIDRDRRPVDLHFKTVKRCALRANGLEDLLLDLLFLKPGDHVKVTLSLTQAEAHGWAAIKREALELLARAKVEVFDLRLEIADSAAPRLAAPGRQAVRARGASDVLYSYVMAEGLPGDALEAGLEVLES